MTVTPFIILLAAVSAVALVLVLLLWQREVRRLRREGAEATELKCTWSPDLITLTASSGVVKWIGLVIAAKNFFMVSRICLSDFLRERRARPLPEPSNFF